jgi:hypothetical protein
MILIYSPKVLSLPRGCPEMGPALRMPTASGAIRRAGLTWMASALVSSFSCMACTEGSENTLCTHVFTSSALSRTPRVGWV